LLTIRFVGLHRLQRLPVAVLAAIGLLAYAAGLVLLAGAAMLGSAAGFAAGCGIALGYAVMHPATTEWSSRRYPAELRALHRLPSLRFAADVHRIEVLCGQRSGIRGGIRR
jgi:hypothetical protein